MRGNRGRATFLQVTGPSIPAYAGEPLESARNYRISAVYPRVCGGTGTAPATPSFRARLSPRMRGNRYGLPRKPGQSASIPAYAGEPSARAGCPFPASVYPRVCGGTRRLYAEGWNAGRLSPRMRGNPADDYPVNAIQASIPAYAGEPSTDQISPWPLIVYPRVCGGTMRGNRFRAGRRRLSPRMRGNLGQLNALQVEGPSIPAYAGEPQHFDGGELTIDVYPRVCGGTGTHELYHWWQARLSPRMRGNRRHPAVPQRGNPSIPAYAGEPALPLSQRAGLGVYPRVCGGTHRLHHTQLASFRLSPRMRGNPSSLIRQIKPATSIPAYAGEPLRRSIAAILRPVYPRVCGETTLPRISIYEVESLSPRMRGNRGQPAGCRSIARSIPAYAGEPSSLAWCAAAGRVYPRVCGGTLADHVWIAEGQGLSPRMRGNPAALAGITMKQGSIPAYAGEPECGSETDPVGRVYPRVCGGTRRRRRKCRLR